jgi:hypothetical protein
MDPSKRLTLLDSCDRLLARLGPIDDLRLEPLRRDIEHLHDRITRDVPLRDRLDDEHAVEPQREPARAVFVASRDGYARARPGRSW